MNRKKQIIKNKNSMFRKYQIVYDIKAKKFENLKKCINTKFFIFLKKILFNNCKVFFFCFIYFFFFFSCFCQSLVLKIVCILFIITFFCYNNFTQVVDKILINIIIIKENFYVF